MEFPVTKEGQRKKQATYCPNPVVRYGIPGYADSLADPKVVNTSAYNEWWEEQLYRCLNGYTTGGIYIPGRYYKFVNFDKVQGVRGAGPPEIHDFQLEFALWIEHLKNVHKNGYLPKARRKSVSAMTVGMVTDYGMRFQYDYHCAVVAGLDEHAQDFVDKWKYIDMHMIDEFKVRRLYTNSGEIVLGYKEKSNQGNKDAGTINTMYIRTVNKNPGVLKGKFCNDIIMEESGENELLLETIQASEDCLRAGQLQVGTFLIYGCVCAGTKVWDSFGNFINIEELKQENGIIGFNERLGEHSKENITYWQPPFKKTCYKITTSTGRVLECSEDHPILSRPYYESKPSQYRHKRFIETKNLRVGDRVATIESIDVWGDKKMFDPRLIGWLVGDGTYGKAQNITLCNADFEIWRYLESKYEIVQEGGSYLTKDRRVLRKCRILGIMDKFMEVGIRGQTKDNKRLPPGIHSYCKEDVCEFLGGYFDADGCAYTNNKTTETFLKWNTKNITGGLCESRIPRHLKNGRKTVNIRNLLMKDIFMPRGAGGSEWKYVRAVNAERSQLKMF